MSTPPVRVWLLRTDLPDATVQALSAVLDATDRQRAGAIAEPAVRAEFVIARAAARLVLGELIGEQPQRLHWSYGPHGKPDLERPAPDASRPERREIRLPWFNLSHSEGLAALAVSWQRPIGVDVQRRRGGTGLDRMVQRYFPAEQARFVCQADDPGEQAARFSMLWSRKEACVKAYGGRLIPGLAWPARAHPEQAGGYLVEAPDGRSATVTDLSLPAGYHGAVALAGAAPFRTQLAWWSAPEAVTVDAEIGVAMAVPRC